MTREMTPPKPNGKGGTTIRVHRCCNGCGREIGDANQSELEAAVAGVSLPDVRSECGCVDVAKVSQP
jgi:hypothetical protein